MNIRAGGVFLSVASIKSSEYWLPGNSTRSSAAEHHSLEDIALYVKSIGYTQCKHIIVETACWRNVTSWPLTLTHHLSSNLVLRTTRRLGVGQSKAPTFRPIARFPSVICSNMLLSYQPPPIFTNQASIGVRSSRISFCIAVCHYNHLSSCHPSLGLIHVLAPHFILSCLLQTDRYNVRFDLNQNLSNPVLQYTAFTISLSRHRTLPHHNCGCAFGRTC